MTYSDEAALLGNLRELDPYEFEELVARIWEKQGWDAEVTSGSADRGVDIVATKTDAFEERTHLIQAKRYGENTAVSSEDIQKYAGLYARDDDVDAVFVVTTSRLTSEAELVANNRNVKTIEGDELVEHVTQYGLAETIPASGSTTSGSTGRGTTRSQSAAEASGSTRVPNEVADSPFDSRQDWARVNADQTHFEQCPECSSRDVWFGSLDGTRHLKCANCEAGWRKVKREKGRIFSRTVEGWKQYNGPNEGTLKKKRDWIS